MLDHMIDAVGQPLEVDDRIAHYSNHRNSSGKNEVRKGTIVAFTEKLVRVLFDGEEKPINMNHYKLVLIKDQTPYSL